MVPRRIRGDPVTEEDFLTALQALVPLGESAMWMLVAYMGHQVLLSPEIGSLDPGSTLIGCYLAGGPVDSAMLAWAASELFRLYDLYPELRDVPAP